MKIEKGPTSFVIENNELENYSFNLVHYFLEKQDYAIFNFEEKILENFHHDYFNIVMIYSKPLFNEVNYETLFEKIDIIRKKLRKNFFLFDQRILVLMTNCSLDLTKLDVPSHIDLINVTEKESLYRNEIIKQVYPDLLTFPLDLSFDTLSYKINSLSLMYAKKLGSIFNKKSYWMNIILGILLMIPYSLQFYLEKDFDPILNRILLTSDNLIHQRFYTLITNTFYESYLYILIIDIFLIISLGRRLEKIFGSIRYLFILLISMIFTNSFIFAFVPRENYFIGFTPVIYAFMGMYMYIIMMFRRFLAYLFQRMLTFNILFVFMIILFGRPMDFYVLIGAILSGFTASFIVGIPKTKNGRLNNRISALIFLGLLTVLSLSIGLK